MSNHRIEAIAAEAPDGAEEVSGVATVVAEAPTQPDQLKAAYRLRNPGSPPRAHVVAPTQPDQLETAL
jgi:hypothetical protein